MNVWEKMRRKKGLTRVEIAKEMGISEEKVKEVEKNMRTMPKNEIDKYIKSIHNMSNGERELKIGEARSWYEKTDFKSLMKEFGFKSQKEVAKAINVDPSSISVWFNKKKGKQEIGNNSLLKLYYFFNDEFNKRISTPEPVVENIIDDNIETSTDRKVLLNWYNNFDMKQGIRDLGFKDQKSFALATGFSQGSLSDWCRKACLPNTGRLMRLYEIFNGKEENKPVLSVADEIEKHNKEMLEWYDKTDFIKLLEEKHITQKELSRKLNLPSSTINNWFRKVSITQKGIETLYNIFNNTKKENDTEIETANYYRVLDQEETTPTYTISTPIDTPMVEDTTKEDLYRLKEENERLRKQTARYEALIDIIISENNVN